MLCIGNKGVNQMDLVSAIVATYNSANTVIETLDSIYDQTYSRIELIVSDDGSTDNTRKIVKEWCKTHYKRFERVLLRNPKRNLGVARNCNHAIAQANGKWISWIAGDDIWLPQCIERRVTYVTGHKCEMVLTQVELFGREGSNLNKMKQYCQRGYKLLRLDIKEQQSEIVKGNFVAGPMGGFFSKDFFYRMGGYDENYPSVEDYPFYYKLIMKGYEIPFLEETLARYRIADNSLCHSNGYVLNDFTKSLRHFFYQKQLWGLLKYGYFRVAWELHMRYSRL